MPQSTFQPSFAGGEMSPELNHRTDLQKYAIGAAKIKNMVVLPRGGLRSRTGTKYIAATINSTKQSRLVEFIFSKTQAYMLEFGDYYIRFYKDGGTITTDGTTPYEITTPYALADIWGLKFEQSADTLFIVHNNYAPRRLTRTGHTAWTLAICQFINGPLLKENITDTTLTLTGAGGDWLLTDTTVTVTASAALFNAQHVGSVWGIRCTSHAASYTFNMPTTTNITSPNYRIFGDWEISIRPHKDLMLDEVPIYIEKSVDKGVTWFKLKTVRCTQGDNSTINVSGSEAEPCLFRLIHNGASVDDAGSAIITVTGKQAWACFKITGYTSSTQVTAVMQSDYNKGAISFKSWAEAAWSDYRGWPGAIGFYQNRLIFGGTKYEPNGVWKSVIDDYENLERDIPQVDDNAIYQRLVGRSVNAINWLVAAKALICLTDASEWTVQPGNSGTLTYNSIKITPETYWGCSGQVEPVVLGNMVIFAQKEGGKVRSIGYDYSVDGYTGSDLSVMADHLFDGYSIVDWSYQQSPHSILWCVRSDGVLLSFTFHKEHDVWAWARHYTQGKFESVACIPGDGQDDVYFIVNRTIGGQTKRYVEMLAHRDVSAKANYFGVDCGWNQVYGSPTSTVSGLGWLEGCNVAVNADGLTSYKTVSSGAITLDKAASSITVGLEFEWEYESLSVDAGVDNKKLVGAVGISVIASQGGKISTPTGLESTIRYPNNTQELYTGDIQDIPITANWGYNGKVKISGKGTMPFHLTTITPKVTSGGK